METNFRELEPLEKIIIPNTLRKKLGFRKKDKLHIQIHNDNDKNITLKIKKYEEAS